MGKFHLTCLRHLCTGLLLSCCITAQAANDKHPDFSGIWTWYAEPGKSPFGMGPRPALPFTPQAKEKVDAYTALITPTMDNPGAHCLGTGMPGSMLDSGGYPMEIIQQPEQITVIYEAHTETRRVYLGAREIPPGDRLPGRNGYSSGHWEGDTLVVETTNLKEQEDQRYAHSEQARIVEKYRLSTDAKGNKTLIARMTMTDPVFYTAPVSEEKKWTFVPNGHLLPYECDEQGWLDHLDELKKKAASRTP